MDDKDAKTTATAQTQAGNGSGAPYDLHHDNTPQRGRQPWKPAPKQFMRVRAEKKVWQGNTRRWS